MCGFMNESMSMKSGNCLAFFFGIQICFAGFDEVVVVPEGAGFVAIAVPGILEGATETFEYYHAEANDGYVFLKWTGSHMGDEEGSTNPHYEHHWEIGAPETMEYKVLTAHFSSIYQTSFYHPLQTKGGELSVQIENLSASSVRETYEATPEDGYAFVSWNLYPSGTHPYKRYIFEYDPTLFYTEEIKPISANFAKICTDSDYESISQELDQLREDLATYESLMIESASADDVMEMRPGKLLTIADKDSVQIEMKIETATDLSSDIWSDLKDDSGNEIKASVELPLDGEKRFYRFSSD